MAFDIQNLNPIGGQSRRCTTLTAGALGNGGPARWSYITEDTHATVDGSGYMNAAANVLKVGDIIDVVVVASGALSTYGTHIVVTNASGVVDLTNVTAGSVIDSD